MTKHKTTPAGTLRARREALGLTHAEIGKPLHLTADGVKRGEDNQGTSKEQEIITQDLCALLDLCERVKHGPTKAAPKVSSPLDEFAAPASPKSTDPLDLL